VHIFHEEVSAGCFESGVAGEARRTQFKIGSELDKDISKILPPAFKSQLTARKEVFVVPTSNIKGEFQKTKLGKLFIQLF